MKKLFAILGIVLILGVGAYSAFAGPTPPAPVNKVFVQGRYGEYCVDPIGWTSKGYKVGVWGDSVAIKAQALDTNGHLVNSTFSYKVVETGQTGTMALVDSTNLEYQVSPLVPNGQKYTVDVTVNGVTGRGYIYRDPANCDACHATPPGHIANSANWGKCHECHNLGVVMHKHAYNKGGVTTNCYSCHPAGCLDTDLHATTLNMTCTDCHGDLSKTVDGTFKISGMAGKPLCANCHDSAHAEPVINTKTGARDLFTDSNGHGASRAAKMNCASCHDAPHRVVKPNFTVAGLPNNCSGCHTTQATNNNMAPDCNRCHVSALDPHLVKK